MRDVIHELRIRVVLAILCAADAIERWASAELKKLCSDRARMKTERV